MEPPPPPLTFRTQPCWAVVLLVLIGWQGWLTLQLFGTDQPWQRLFDDQPVLSGRHPLHQYHGLLGAAAWWGRGTLSCFDPWFQAGYPKTPVFDSGSRPAELFFGLAGGGWNPAAYKIGLALACCAVPWLLTVTARGIGLSPGSACLAAVLGMLVWWGDPCRALLEAGDLDVVLAVLAALVHVGLLLRFHRLPGTLPWLGLLGSACLGWFAQPLLFALLLAPLLLVYYHSVGVRHGLAWHLALVAGVAGGVALNAFWLLDWVEYWWLRVPLPTGQRLLTHRTVQTFWDSPLWGGADDRALAMLLFGSGVVGIAVFALQRDRPVARLLALGTVGLLTLALVGTAWEPLGRLGAPQLLVPALWFAVLPAVHAWKWAGEWLTAQTGAAWRAAALAAVVLGSLTWLAQDHLANLGSRCVRTPPLVIGLSAEQKALLAALEQHTTAEARILWEDRLRPPTCSHWAALLPHWTGRPFIGGLDPGCNLEYAHAGLADRVLAGRELREWTDEELHTYCQRSNLGWVVARTAETTARLDAWCAAGTAERTASLTIDGEPAQLFTLQRARSFVLHGAANWLQADCQYVVLGDVTPADGKIVLSLHHVAGLRVSPSSIQIEKDPDPLAMDPIPYLRLKVPARVTRIVLSWE